MTALLTDTLPLLAGAPNGIKKLRELILELAVRGRLLEQNSSDEPACELLKIIAKEKTVLIENKTIRKGKPVPDIEQDEMQFKLPIGWEWVRLGQIGDWGAGATPARGNSSYYGGGMPWFKSGELVADFISDSDESVTELALKECSLRRNKPGDVLIAMYGATIGKTAILNVEGTTNQAVCACTPFSGVFNRYLLLNLKALKSNFIGQGAGGAQPNISREKIVATVTGLPPLAEQHRIVAKVDELMALCDRLEAQQAEAKAAHAQLVQALLDSLIQASYATEFATNWQRLAEHFHTLFTTESSIDALERVVVALALKGKLGTKSALDEPAVTFVLQARADKALASSVSGRKPRGGGLTHAPQSSIEAAALELPDRWTKCRVGDIAECLDYMRVPVNKAERELRRGSIPYYGANGQVGFIDDYLFDEELVLVVEDETFIGRTKPFSYVIKGRSWVNNHAHVLRPLCDMSATYLNLCLQRYDFVPLTSGTTGRRKLTQAGLMTAELLIAPLAEQHRIVAKVDQLTAFCDQLKTRLAEARQLNEQLAKTLVEQAIN